MKVPLRFVPESTQFNDLLCQTKLMVCPHCGREETLIGHGKLMGYPERGAERVVRGQRLFCSNRHARQGCGRTCSVLLAHALRGFSVWTRTLAAFVVAIAQGASIRAGWRAATEGSMGISSGYRLWRRLRQVQVHIRAKLFTVNAPPLSSSPEPWAQLLEHMKQVVLSQGCPFAGFQHHFQSDLMS